MRTRDKFADTPNYRVDQTYLMHILQTKTDRSQLNGINDITKAAYLILTEVITQTFKEIKSNLNRTNLEIKRYTPNNFTKVRRLLAANRELIRDIFLQTTS